MNSHKKGSYKAYFILTIIFTVPAYILVGLASNNLFFKKEMAITFLFLSVIAPLGAALLLSYRENGREGVKKLFAKSFDFKKITKKIWYLPILFLIPFIFVTVYGTLILAGLSIPTAQFPYYTIPIQFILFFVMAIGEELGWMGYAYEPLEKKFGIFKATIILGIIWAIWHIPFYYYLMGELLYILLLPLCLFGIRIILVWIYNHTKQSVFGVICFHAIYNVTIGVVPNYNINEGLIITCILILITAVIITVTVGTKNRTPITS